MTGVAERARAGGAAGGAAAARGPEPDGRGRVAA